MKTTYDSSNANKIIRHQPFKLSNRNRQTESERPASTRSMQLGLGFANLSVARKNLHPRDFRNYHYRAQEAVKELKTCESQLIRCLQDVDKNKVHRYLGCNSLFQYCLTLGLTEHQAYTYISVARKALECPELQKAIDNQEITVPVARRVTAVMNERNQMKWLELARTLSKRDLEKEVAKEKPKAVFPESARYATDHLLNVQISMHEDVFQLLKRAQELIMQKTQSPVDLEKTVQILSEEYIRRHDPVEKAKRSQLRKSAQQSQQKESHLKKNQVSELAVKQNQQDQDNQLMTNQDMSKESSPSQPKLVDQKENLAPVRIDTNNIRPLASKNSAWAEFMTDHNRSRKMHSNPSSRSSSKLGLGSGSGSGSGLDSILGLSSGLGPDSKSRSNSKVRSHIPKKILHQVHLRDQGQCCFRSAQGARGAHGTHEIRCSERKWLELHHIKPVAAGGRHELNNLITLCSFHHKQIHENL